MGRVGLDCFHHDSVGNGSDCGNRSGNRKASDDQTLHGFSASLLEVTQYLSNAREGLGVGHI
jgi:hypothetical protein